MQRLDATPLPPPHLIALDENGTHCDVPALLTQRLLGQIDVAGPPKDPYFPTIAGLLPQIHAVETDPAFARDMP